MAASQVSQPVIPDRVGIRKYLYVARWFYTTVLKKYPSKGGTIRLKLFLK